MSTTLNREAIDAVQFFKAKLEYEIGPYSLDQQIRNHDPIKVIDLRTQDAYAKGHVPGATNIQIEELDTHLSNFKKDETIVVYCYSITCALSTKAALHLADKGYKVKELFGGWQEWSNAGLNKEEKAHAGSCATTKGSSCG